jgi:hypothetical protein
MLPNRIWLTNTLSLGKGVSKRPKPEVPDKKRHIQPTQIIHQVLHHIPVSPMMMSLGLKNFPTLGQNQDWEIVSLLSVGTVIV